MILFREQALQSTRHRLEGAVRLSVPFRQVTASVVLCATVAGIGLVLVFGSYTRSESALGLVVPTAGAIKVYARQAGVLTALSVNERAIVKQGELLALVSNKRDMRDANDADGQIIAELTGVREQLTNKQSEETGLAKSEITLARQRIQRVRSDITRLEEIQDAQEESLKLSEARVHDIARLRSEGYLSESQFKTQYQEYLSTKTRFFDTRRELLDRQQELQELDLQLAMLPAQQALRAADLANQLSEAQQRLVDMESRREAAITAPVGGRVTALQMKVGQFISSDIPLLTIVPDDSSFEVELFVASTAIGLLEPGQEVAIRYHAFPYQRYGVHGGRVVEVASSMLASNEIPERIDVRAESIYRVTVKLDRQMIDAYGKQFPLQAGMLLDASISLDRRPIWQWLLEPILTLKGRI